jgi:hypothetical protein
VRVEEAAGVAGGALRRGDERVDDRGEQDDDAAVPVDIGLLAERRMNDRRQWTIEKRSESRDLRLGERAARHGIDVEENPLPGEAQSRSRRGEGDRIGQ